MGILTSDLMTKQVMSNCFRFRASHLIDTISIISEILGMISGRFSYPDHNQQQERLSQHMTYTQNATQHLDKT